MPTLRLKRRWGMVFLKPCPDAIAYGLEFITPSRDLRPHVAILVELANLLNFTVGVAARLDQVKLDIEGVEADVLLKVRLKHIRAILEKVLDTIGEHPEILRILSRSVSRVVRESLGDPSPRSISSWEGWRWETR